MKNLLKKLSPLFALVLVFTMCCGIVGCGEPDENTNSAEKEPCTTHNWVLVSTTATCVSDGVDSYKCSVCGATDTKSAKKTGIHRFSGDSCEMCGIPKQPITISDVTWHKVSGASAWYSVEGNAKNISTQSIKVKLTCFLYNDNNEIVGKNDTTETILPSEIAGISFLVRHVNLEWNYYVIKLEIDTLEPYDFRFEA